MIDWLPWSSEAFERAGREGKPVLLAMGAAWCEMTRRMDAETYADAECVSLIRDHFVPVRVDLDRHPDVFDRYGMGGSPSTAFLMPAGDIIAGTTLVAPSEMCKILANLGPVFRLKREALQEGIQAREDRIEQVQAHDYPPAESVGPAIFQNTLRGILATVDSTHGGFGSAPKLPLAASVSVVLHAYAETGGADFAQILRKTLDAMAGGALFDAVDGGFFHCALNERWTQPYHAKLLVNQAALLELYARAAILLDRPLYAERAERTWAYVRSRLAAISGLWFAGQASDPAYYADRTLEPPPVDRTIFADANARMASALFAGAACLEKPEWGAAASAAVDGLLALADGDLFHYAVEGRAHRPDLCRDGVAMALALIDRYEWAGDAADLGRAARLLDLCHERFWDGDEGGLRDRSGPAETAPMERPRKHLSDNAAAALADLRLAALTGKPAHRERAGSVLLAFPNYQQDYGHATAEFGVAADWYARPAVEVRLSGPLMRKAALGVPLPRRAVRTEPVGPAVVVHPGHAPVEVRTPEELVRCLKG